MYVLFWSHQLLRLKQQWRLSIFRRYSHAQKWQYYQIKFRFKIFEDEYNFWYNLKINNRLLILKNLDNFALLKQWNSKTQMTLHCSKKKRTSCSDKLTFLNRLFLNARTFICWLANFFVLFFLEDARILIFFFFVVIVRLLFLKFSIFFLSFFSLNKLCFIFFSS